MISFDFARFNSLITDYCKTHFVTNIEFCNRAKISRTAWRHYRRCENVPNVAIACRIANVLDCSPLVFVGSDGGKVTFDRDTWVRRISIAQECSGREWRDIAESIGVNKTLMCQYKRGKSLMTIERAARFAEETKTPLVWLLGGELE